MRDLFFGMTPVPSGQRLLISMSGGRTSAYMAIHILEQFKSNWDEIIIVFANTGQEHEATLEFVRNLDEQYGLQTVWVEAVVHRGVKQTTHRVVDFESASRQGEPFEAVIAKYGIPNTKHPHCTRELKQRPIESYAKSLGWGRSYTTAIGIRPDERRRVSKNAAACSIVYPLIDWVYADKEEVLDWWKSQAVNLQIPEHYGNCTWCWKKSYIKHARLLSELPAVYDFPERMELLYGDVGPDKEKREAPHSFPRKFFRESRTTANLRAYCSALDVGQQELSTHKDQNTGGCGESCELYQTELVQDVA